VRAEAFGLSKEVVLFEGAGRATCGFRILGGSGIHLSGPFVKIRERGVVTRHIIADELEGGQAGARPIGLADGDRTAQSDDRGLPEDQELVVPLHDLHPVGVGGSRRIRVQRRDRSLRLVLAQPVSCERRLQDCDSAARCERADRGPAGTLDGRGRDGRGQRAPRP
jgi:hypothetical protein